MNPKRLRQNELRTFRLNIIEMIRDSNCWHDIKVASDAMFHANLIWKAFNKECERFEICNEDATEQVMGDGN